MGEVLLREYIQVGNDRKAAYYADAFVDASGLPKWIVYATAKPASLLITASPSFLMER